MRVPLTPIVLLSLAGLTLADEIHLTDGKSITDVSIQSETMTEVTYRKDRKEGKVPADTILSIDYSAKPQLVDQADASMRDGLFEDAEVDLTNFLAGVKAKRPRKYPWSRAYAYYRLAEVYEVLQSIEDVKQTVNEMAELEPESRYLPYAISIKARALADSGDKASALAALGDLEKVVASAGLGDRWKLEVELGKLLYGDATGASLRKKLQDLADLAGSGNPVVRNRALAEIGISLLGEGKLDEGEKIFRSIVSDPKADDRTLAAAHTGLGHCLFRRGEPTKDPELLKEALKAFMRVVVLYGHEINYVPEALFFAGRCFQLIGGDEAELAATKLYTRVMRDFPENRWAGEARGFRSRKK